MPVAGRRIWRIAAGSRNARAKYDDVAHLPA